MYKVGEIAELSGVSVRTLHHYDQIGLLVASGRSDSGYRLYSAADITRLTRILFYRELEFGLDQITEILAEDATNDHLRDQHALLRTRLARTRALLDALETEMEAQMMGLSLTPEEQMEVFGSVQTEEHMAEAEERWGDTAAYKESARRTAAYRKQDWLAIKAETDDLNERFAVALRGGQPVESEQTQALAEAHREHLNRWFFDCSHQMHVRLTESYVSDPRFAVNYEQVEPGLAQYVHAAALANAAAHGVG